MTKYEENSLHSSVMPVFWSMLCQSKEITQATLLRTAGINKKSFHRHRSDYVPEGSSEPTLTELCAYWLAKDENLRFRAIAFPIQQTSRKSRGSNKTSSRPRTEKKLPYKESLLRAILTLLGWNSSGVKTLNLWTIKPHQANSELILSAKKQALGLEPPSWCCQKANIPNSIANDLMHLLQTSEIANDLQQECCLNSFKAPDEDKIGWLLTGFFSYIALIANPVLSKYDKELADLFVNRQKNLGWKPAEPWLLKFAWCLNTIFAQSERLLLLREGVLHETLEEVSLDNIRGFDVSTTSFKRLYPEEILNRQQKHMPEENFATWRF